MPTSIQNFDTFSTTIYLSIIPAKSPVCCGDALKFNLPT